jgi:hypothetical protein
VRLIDTGVSAWTWTAPDPSLKTDSHIFKTFVGKGLLEEHEKHRAIRIGILESDLPRGKSFRPRNPAVGSARVVFAQKGRGEVLRFFTNGTRLRDDWSDGERCALDILDVDKAFDKVCFLGRHSDAFKADLARLGNKAGFSDCLMKCISLDMDAMGIIVGKKG